MELILVIVIGLIIGSFLNVCIYRIVREESIAFPPSHCTSCGYKLKAKDLIPVISYIILGGRCRSCKEKISIKYPIVEILNAFVYALLYLNYGLNLDFFKYCILSSLLIVIALIDFKTQFVYSSTVLFGVVIGSIFCTIQWIIDGKIPFDNIIAAAIGFGVIWLIFILTGGMGEGDINIALVCGLFLGVKGITVTLYSAFIIGGIVASVILALKIKGRKSQMAFGPYLALGAIIAMFYADKIISYYSKFIIR